MSAFALPHGGFMRPGASVPRRSPTMYDLIAIAAGGANFVLLFLYVFAAERV
jgi:hypothetical protein